MPLLMVFLAVLLLLALLPQQAPLASAAHLSPQLAIDGLYNSPQPNIINLPAVNKSQDSAILEDASSNHSFSAQIVASHAFHQLLPPCAKACFANNASNVTAPCPSWNLSCICTSEHSKLAFGKCYMKQCNTASDLLTANLTTLACHGHPSSRSQSFADLNIILAVFSSLTVVLRLAYKLAFLRSDLGFDDIVVTAMLAVSLAETYVSARMAQLGLGRDIWTLPWYSSLGFVYYFFVNIVLYFSLMWLIKLSLLLFYLRIFPRSVIRHLLWATIAFNCAFGLTSMLVAIFQCRPVSFYWSRYLGDSNGHCISVNVLGWVNAIVCIALDIWILFLALSQLYHVRLRWNKKLQVAAMFSTGTLFTVASIIRLHSLIVFGSFDNPSWRQFWLVVWSTTEINVGIICVSMPALRLIAVHLSRRANRIGLMSSSRHRHHRLDGTEQPNNQPLVAQQRIFAYGLGYGYDYTTETKAPHQDEQGNHYFDIGFGSLMGFYHRIWRPSVHEPKTALDLQDFPSTTDRQRSTDHDKSIDQLPRSDSTKQPHSVNLPIHQEFSDGSHDEEDGIHILRSYHIDSSQPTINDLMRISTAVQPHIRNNNVWRDDR